jgi:hypothetical protein
MEMTLRQMLTYLGPAPVPPRERDEMDEIPVETD